MRPLRHRSSFLYHDHGTKYGKARLLYSSIQAGRGNRTPDASLENWGIATIRYPHDFYDIKNIKDYNPSFKNKTNALPSVINLSPDGFFPVPGLVS